MSAFKRRNTVRARELRNAATPAERSMWRYLANSQLGDRYLRDAGYRVVLFPNAEVLANVESVITAIRLALGSLPTPDPSRKREGGYAAYHRNTAQ